MQEQPTHRHSHYHADMYSVEEARSSILATIHKLEEVSVPITDSLGMVLSADVESSLDIPPFNNS